jgi:hypothetical protein
MLTKKGQSKCEKCPGREFRGMRGLRTHQSKAHPYVCPPAPLPKPETTKASGEEETTQLIGGRNFEIGDVIWLGRKCTITEITKAEGSPDVKVKLLITKRWYSRNQIF